MDEKLNLYKVYESSGRSFFVVATDELSAKLKFVNHPINSWLVQVARIDLLAREHQIKSLGIEQLIM